MKKVVIILFSLFFVLACKTESSSRQMKEKQTLVLPKKESVYKSLIPVFTIIYDSLYLDKKEQIPNFNKTIKDICVNDAKENKTSFKGNIKWHKKKTFQKVLARDFGNEKFMEIKKSSLSFVKVRTNTNLSSQIAIEEWLFKDEKTAKSCFDSFNGYEEREIYFKSISWIWFLKDNKLFLLFSVQEDVRDKPMQILRENLKEFLEVDENHIKEVY